VSGELVVEVRKFRRRALTFWGIRRNVSGCAVAVQWLCSGCAVAVQWLCSGCAVAVQWLCSGCAVAVQWLSAACRWLCSDCQLPVSCPLVARRWLSNLFFKLEKSIWGIGSSSPKILIKVPDFLGESGGIFLTAQRLSTTSR